MTTETEFGEILDLFNEGLQKEIQAHKQKLPYACCSFHRRAGRIFLNARFVSLKEIRDGEFIITGTITSRKGEEIKIIIECHSHSGGRKYSSRSVFRELLFNFGIWFWMCILVRETGQSDRIGSQRIRVKN